MAADVGRAPHARARPEAWIHLTSGSRSGRSRPRGLPSLEDPSEAMVAVETLHGRLLLEACWLALKGENRVS